MQIPDLLLELAPTKSLMRVSEAAIVTSDLLYILERHLWVAAVLFET